MFWRRKQQTDAQYLLFGLGNPGIEYVRTRHNIGWWVLDELARRHGTKQSGHRHHGQFDVCQIQGKKCLLIKPTTFMNRSGRCISAWLRDHDETPYCVIYDDISMETGKARLRDTGSSGGHNGVKDIIRALGQEQFDRLKIGVGKPPPGEDAADYVLEVPSAAEEELIAAAVTRAADSIEQLVSGDRDGAVNSLVRLG